MLTHKNILYQFKNSIISVINYFIAIKRQPSIKQKSTFLDEIFIVVIADRFYKKKNNQNF